MAQLVFGRQDDDGNGTWDLDEQRTRYATGRADFKAHMNPEGTWLDFGKIATDGSVKVNKEQNRLVVFSYPRDEAFGVELDVTAFASAPGSDTVRVTALAAGTQEAMGPVSHERDGDRIRFQTGVKGAGRYVVEWQ